MKVCPKHYCLSTVGVRDDLFRRDTKTVPVTDFFGSLRPVELTDNIVNIPLTLNESGTIEKIQQTDKKLHYIKQFPDISTYVQ